MRQKVQLAFHGRAAAGFRPGFEGWLPPDLIDGLEIVVLGDELDDPGDRRRYAASEIIVGTAFDETFPQAEVLRLFHVPGAGTDAVALELLPKEAAVCNCFGHEQAIAEYVFATLLTRVVPVAAADAGLRQGDWSYTAGAPGGHHEELAGKTIGLLGYGHIGRAIATRAKAMEMRVHVANRSPVALVSGADQSFALDDLASFWASADIFVVSLPLVEDTRSLVGAAAFAAMRPNALIVNVGRGPVIDEQALFDALRTNRISGAIIDTWYQYPDPSCPQRLPSKLPFHELENIVMTPHMSGWTSGTMRRRQQTIADNVSRLATGRPLLNVIREAAG